MSEARKQQILAAIKRRLDGHAGSIDPVALAAEIDAALGADPADAGAAAGRPAPATSAEGAYARIDEGRTPAELNASNDDGRG